MPSESIIEVEEDVDKIVEESKIIEKRESHIRLDDSDQRKDMKKLLEELKDHGMLLKRLEQSMSQKIVTPEKIGLQIGVVFGLIYVVCKLFAKAKSA